MNKQPGPLSGVRVLELGNFIAAPYAGRIFAEFGAEVIKVERPRVGDELRQWRLFHGDTSLFWLLQSRNKKSITLDLHKPKGQEIALKLIQHADVVLENFRPGTLEKWNLGYDEMRRVNPHIILVRISGYGQTGPYRDRPGFASVAEAIGGLRYLTGYPDRPPTRVGVSLGDSLAGLFGVIGALIALLHRQSQAKHEQQQGPGQVVDIALYEAVFAITESLLPEYDGYDIIRQRTGNILPGLTPTNTYICKEQKWVAIGGNADGVFKRLMYAIDQAELVQDPRFSDNVGRSQHRDFLDRAISDWTSQHTLSEVMITMVEAGVPAGPIFDAADIAHDPHFQAREMLEDHVVAITHNEEKHVRFPGIVPKLSETPGETRWLGPALGEQNDEVYRQILDLPPEDIAALQQEMVI